jgi:hypothetical protein
LKQAGKSQSVKWIPLLWFYVVKGEVLLKRNDESAILRENQVFISEPALLSMETTSGARLMGIQIKT